MKVIVEQAANGSVLRDEGRDETVVLLDDEHVSFALAILKGILDRTRGALVTDRTEAVDPVLDTGDGEVDEKRSRGWAPHEISSMYAMVIHRVVSLVVTYDDSKSADRKAGIENIHSPATAAGATLDLTRDSGSGGTVWRVFDSKTGTMHSFTQREFEKRDV